MKHCPDERTLERLFAGDGRGRQARHVAACPECGLRMRRIEQDLGRIREALFAEPPPALVRDAARGRPGRALVPALALGAAAACVAALLWVRPLAPEAAGNPAELSGFVQNASQALFPALEEEADAAANPSTVQLAALGAALIGGRPCTVEDRLDTSSCEVQDVTTLAESW